MLMGQRIIALISLVATIGLECFIAQGISAKKKKVTMPKVEHVRGKLRQWDS